MRLVWSQHATDDRLAIFTWIAQDDPQAAANIDERIEEAPLGGWSRIDRVFNGQLDEVVRDINENIWKKAG